MTEFELTFEEKLILRSIVEEGEAIAQACWIRIQQLVDAGYMPDPDASVEEKKAFYKEVVVNKAQKIEASDDVVDFAISLVIEDSSFYHKNSEGQSMFVSCEDEQCFLVVPKTEKRKTRKAIKTLLRAIDDYQLKIIRSL